MPERRMAAVSIAFAAGILISDWLGWLSCTLLLVSCIGLVLIFGPARLRGTAIVLGLVLVAGAARYAIDRTVAPDDISRTIPNANAFEGRVASDVTPGTGSIRFTLGVSRARSAGRWHRASGNVMVSVYGSPGKPMPRLAYGDRARIMAEPYSPSEPTNPGQFSWNAYLARHGIYACASVRDPSEVRTLAKAGARSLTGLPSASKRLLLSSIRKLHSAESASAMSGIVLGSYAFIDEQTRIDFQNTGTLHVLAASGYNCFIIVLLAMRVLMLLRLPVFLRSILSTALLGLYLAMVGAAPSLVRAAVMSALALFAAPLRRVPNYTNLFYVAGLIVLLVRPSDLFDVGFQLSFLAVGALIYVVPLIEALWRFFSFDRDAPKTGWNRRLSPIRGAASKAARWFASFMASTAVATTAVGLVTAPVVAYYFHYVSLTSLPANLAVALMVPIIFVASLLSPVLQVLPYAESWAGFVGTAATRVTLCVVNYFGAMKYSSISVQSPGLLALVGYYLLLYAGGRYARSRFGKG